MMYFNAIHITFQSVRVPNENSPSALDSNLTFIADASAISHPLLSQYDLDRGQATVGSGREVRKNEHSDESGKYRQSTLNVE
jgi:hypothetical protein